MRRLDDKEKKIMFRYRGTGKFAVRKAEKQAEAKERNEAYQKKISTRDGLMNYLTSTRDIGKKQMAKLKSMLK